MSAFRPKLDILPPAQRRLWDGLGEIPKAFILYGGTAIALHLGHRQSIDFDFFCWESFASLTLFERIPLLAGSKVIQSEPNTLTVLVGQDNPVQLSFFGLPSLKAIAPAQETTTGLHVASLMDLAGMKAATVQQRAEAKDYIDLDAIFASGALDLPQALSAARLIYGERFAPEVTLKALTWFEEPALRALPASLKTRLVALVRAVDLDNLPSISLGDPS